MRIPILQLLTPPTINDNPSPKDCLWLDLSLTPPKLKRWNSTKNEWESISSDGSITNTNKLDPNKEYVCWIGTKAEFDALDSLEPTTWYIVKGVGQFIGTTPLYIANPGVVFVNAAYTGKHNFGISWEYPFANLQDAINSANEGDQVWVTQGTYKNSADSDNCFTVTKKLTILGGFAGTEKTILERKLKVKTILDGEGARRIVNNAADNVVFNGFSFQNGLTTGKGGAILSTRLCEVQNCEFINNKASYGGAISGVTTVRNGLFIKNIATVNGNSIHCTRTSLLSACTIAEGSGPNAIFSENGVNVQVYNTVTWTSTVGGDGIVAGASSVISHCASSAELPSGNDNILLSRTNDGVEEGITYSRFVNPADNNFRLTRKSGLVDKGVVDNTILTTDFDGNPRVVAGGMDIGCFEFQNPDNVRTVAGKTGDVILEIPDVTGLEDALKEDDTNLENHINDKENPHEVTKEQVGLGNVDNTSDENKPVSTPQQQALDKLKEELLEEDGKITESLNNHIKDTENPHQVTKEQVGLGLADNTPDIQKPVSKPQQDALDELKESLLESDSQIQQNLNDHINNKKNPHEVSKEQLGLEHVDNTHDTDKPVSMPQKEYIDNQIKNVDGNISEVNTDLQEHKNNHENPHAVTKQQVGLGNVDNTSDLDKPISTATGAALAGINNILKTKADLDSEGKVPTSQLPDSILGNVKYHGLWDAVNNEPHLVNGETSKNGWYYICINSGVQLGFEFEAGDWVINNNGKWEKVDNVDAVQLVNGKKGIVVIGIADIPGLEDILNSMATAAALKAHVDNTTNPHAVTKQQVGLGNVDNTSDQDKPISNLQQKAFDNIDKILGKKADLDENNTVPVSQLPAICLNNLRYEGWWDAENNTPPLDNGEPKNNGKFYVVQHGGTRFGQTFRPGDWIVNYNGTWGKVDLQEVKQLTPSVDKGNVIITIDENGVISANIDRTKLWTKAYVRNGDFMYYIFETRKKIEDSIELGADFSNSVCFVTTTRELYVDGLYYAGFNTEKITEILNEILGEKGLLDYGTDESGNPTFKSEILLREKDLSWNTIQP